MTQIFKQVTEPFFEIRSSFAEEACLSWPRIQLSIPIIILILVNLLLVKPLQRNTRPLKTIEILFRSSSKRGIKSKDDVVLVSCEDLKCVTGGNEYGFVVFEPKLLQNSLILDINRLDFTHGVIWLLIVFFLKILYIDLLLIRIIKVR